MVPIMPLVNIVLTIVINLLSLPYISGGVINDFHYPGQHCLTHAHQMAIGRGNPPTERYVPGRAVQTAFHRMPSTGAPAPSSHFNVPFPSAIEYGRGVDKVPQQMMALPQPLTVPGHVASPSHPPSPHLSTRMSAAVALSQQLRLLQERRNAASLVGLQTNSIQMERTHRPSSVTPPPPLLTSTPPFTAPPLWTSTPSTETSPCPNYCDDMEYPPTKLDGLRLKRLDRFVYNQSCSPLFFQCSLEHTFPLQCPDPDGQAFDPLTSGCNFKNSVRFCADYDHVLHCTIREFCSANQFACCQHPQKCLDLQRRCDGHPDCSDGEDENNCPSCARNEFACVKSGRCVEAKKRCDRVADDCGDGSNADELGCSRNTTCWGKFVCDSHATLNSAGHSVCIERDKYCDGKRDCPGGEDELDNCNAIELKYLTCENQKQSVRREEWCNGREECLDGSDEKYCF